MPSKDTRARMERLDTLDGLVAACQTDPFGLIRGDSDPSVAKSPRGEIFCVDCMDVTRAAAVCIDNGKRGGSAGDLIAAFNPKRWKPAESVSAKWLAPSLFLMECLVCSRSYSGVVYHADSGPALAILPGPHGAAAPLDVPPQILAYLQEAIICQLVGAHTAAIAMYRSALEVFLCDQGFSNHFNLSEKIKAFLKAAPTSTDKPWMRLLTSEAFNSLKGLGDWAVHSDGDKANVNKHMAMDAELSESVSIVFKFILQHAYILPAEQQRRSAAVAKSLEELGTTSKKRNTP